MSALLLLSAFILKGAKTEFNFELWSIILLGIAGWSFWTHKRQLPLVLCVGGALFLVWTMFSTLVSIDPATSLRPALQLVLIALAGYLFYLDLCEGIPGRTWAFLLYCFTAISLVASTHQWIIGQAVHGYLPINPNFNAALLATLALCLTDRALHHPMPPAQRVFEGVAGTLCGFFVLAGHSRSAFIGLIFGVVVLFGYRRSWNASILATGGGILIGIATFSDWFVNRFRLFLNEGGLQLDRIKFWEIAWRSFLERPWFGVGPGNFELVYQRFAFPVDSDPVRFSRTTAFAHNEFLQILTESGLPAALLLIAACCWLLSQSVRNNTLLDAQAKSILTCLLVIACLNPIWQMPFLLLWTLFWAAILLQGRFRTETTKARWTRSRLLLGCLLISIVPLHLKIQIPESFNNVYVRERIAREFESNGDLDTALAHYHQCISLAPYRAINYLAIGRILYRKANIQEARKWFEDTRRIEPHYWETDLWLARCFQMQGDSTRALFTLDYLLQRYRPYKPESNYDAMILAFDRGTVLRYRHALLTNNPQK